MSINQHPQSDDIILKLKIKFIFLVPLLKTKNKKHVTRNTIILTLGDAH